MQIEIAVFSRQFYHLLQLHQLFANAPMRDQALDRTHAQSVFFAELHQLWQARHRPVVVQNFAKHSGRLQPSHAGKIDRRLRVTGAAQHAAIFGAERKNVARLHQIAR